MNKWTDDEKNFIINEYKSDKTIDEIYQMGKIKRSRYAIECKLYGYIYDMLQNGKSYSSIAKEFNKTKDEIKEIEKIAFEIKNQTDVKTVYTGDGGYKYGENKIIKDSDIFLEIGKIHNINRTINAVLCYYENIERLNRLKESKTIDDDFYKKLILQINEFTFDKEKILKSFKKTENNTEQNNSEQNNSEQNNSEQNNQIIEIPKKKNKSNNDDDNDDFYMKKIKKRLV